MQVRKLIAAVVLLAGLFASSTSAQYWYGVNDTIPLFIDSSKVLVKLGGGFSPQGVFSSVTRIVTVLENEQLIDGFIFLRFTVKLG